MKKEITLKSHLDRIRAKGLEARILKAGGRANYIKDMKAMSKLGLAAQEKKRRLDKAAPKVA